jgi:phosphatidylserine synthase
MGARWQSETHRCQVNFGISPAFEQIDWMVRNIEHAALIVAGLLALACVACEWRA